MKTKTMELYLHIPFCVQKCNYCDFCSFQASKEVITDYMAQLKREIAAWGSRLSDKTVSTVFIGGGTPSCIDAAYIAEICQCTAQNFSLEQGAEITMEANPGTVTMEKLQTYRQAGITRLSFGLQSTIQEELDYLGRIHTYEGFLESFHMARACGFDNINVDLMSAVPKQTLSTYEASLRTVAKLAPEHISAYSLIIEDGTAFAEDQELWKYLPTEEEEVRMYQMTKDILGEYGYSRYEISNYSKTGYECKHNLGYWSQIPYLGLGLAAASYLEGKRFSNPDSMEKYQQMPSFFQAFEEAEPLSVNEKIEEFMFLGLRKQKGVSREEFFQTFHKTMDSYYQRVIEKSIEQGWIAEEGDFIALTDQGILISNQVLCEFLL